MAHTKRFQVMRGAGVVATAAVLAVLSMQSCVFDSTETVVCESGLRCPTGWRCAAFQDVCISDGCGDGLLDRTAGER